MVNGFPSWLTSELAIQLIEWIDKGNDIPNWLLYGNKLSFKNWLEEYLYTERGEELQRMQTGTNEEWVEMVMHELNVPDDIKGYKYMFWCLLEELRDPGFVEIAPCEINKRCAKEMGVSPAAVNCGIYSVILKMEQRDKKPITDILGADMEGNSPSCFLKYVAKILKSRMCH